MKISVEYSAVSNCGKVRKENQDRIYIDNNTITPDEDGNFAVSGVIESDKNVIFAVFVGMGGEEKGGQASQIAVDYVTDKSNESAEDMCFEINELICDYMKKNSVVRMGTTAAILEMNDKTVTVCNVGDSGIFRISNLEIGIISQEHAINVGKKRVLTQHLGIPKNELMLEPFTETTEFKPNDIFLLCSDGLTDMVDEVTIADIIIENSVSDAAKLLFLEAMNNGGKDNISAVVCKLKTE